MRNLLTDIVVTLTTSNHTTKLLSIALPKLTDRDMEHKTYTLRIKATNINIQKYLYKDDPSEIKLAFNEILHLLTTNDHTITVNTIIYWLLWLHKLDQIRRKNKNPLITHIIKVKDVNKKYHQDWIWILWKILLDLSKKQANIKINHN